MYKLLNLLTPMIIIAVVIFFTSPLRANQPPCEVWNYDTESCEKFADQNITLNPVWIEFYNWEN